MRQKELGHIPVAQLVAYTAEQDLKDDIGGDFDKVEWRIRPLIERTTTLFAPIHVVTQTGMALKNRDSG